jgi:hypothetical protein
MSSHHFLFTSISDQPLGKPAFRNPCDAESTVVVRKSGALSHSTPLHPQFRMSSHHFLFTSISHQPLGKPAFRNPCDAESTVFVRKSGALSRSTPLQVQFPLVLSRFPYHYDVRTDIGLSGSRRSVLRFSASRYHNPFLPCRVDRSARRALSELSHDNKGALKHFHAGGDAKQIGAIFKPRGWKPKLYDAVRSAFDAGIAQPAQHIIHINSE